MLVQFVQDPLWNIVTQTTRCAGYNERAQSVRHDRIRFHELATYWDAYYPVPSSIRCIIDNKTRISMSVRPGCNLREKLACYEMPIVMVGEVDASKVGAPGASPITTGMRRFTQRMWSDIPGGTVQRSETAMKARLERLLKLDE